MAGARCPVDDAVTSPDGPLADDDPLVGTELVEGYKAVRRLPSGGGGATYEIVQEVLGRPATLRLLDLTEEESFGVAERFGKVYSTLFAIEHPGLPAVQRFGRTSDGLRLYVVTAASVGTCLEDTLLGRRPLSTPRAVDIALRLADALEALHAAGLVHGDVCPARVWVQADEDALDVVSLADSGLFEVMAARPHVSSPAEGGRWFCDPRTMSPEVAAGYAADARSDLYALGILLGMMLTGDAPFRGATRAELLGKHLREPYPVSSLVGVPEDLKRLVLRLVDKSPGERFQTAAELKLALQNTLDLFEMIGHDTDPNLTALIAPQESPAAWGDMVTIGDGGADGGPTPALASPSVLLREASVAAIVPPRRQHSTALLVLATSLIFLLVGGLVAVRFLTSTDAEPSRADEPVASLQRQAPPARAGAPENEPGKARPVAAVVSASPSPPVSAPSTAPASPAAPSPQAPPVPASAAATTALAERPGQPVAIELRSDPLGAVVMRDGFKLGTTPLAISLQSRKAFMVTLEKPGYVANAVEIVPEERLSYDIHLQVAEAPVQAPTATVSPNVARTKPAAKKPAADARPAATKGAGEGAERKTPPHTGYDLF